MSLTDLAKEKISWNWSKQEENNFAELKGGAGFWVSNAPPHFDRQFFVTTDVSDVTMVPFRSEVLDKAPNQWRLPHENYNVETSYYAYVP